VLSFSPLAAANVDRILRSDPPAAKSLPSSKFFPGASQWLRALWRSGTYYAKGAESIGKHSVLIEARFFRVAQPQGNRSFSGLYLFGQALRPELNNRRHDGLLPWIFRVCIHCDHNSQQCRAFT